MEAWMESLDCALTARGWDVVVALAKGPQFHDPEKYLSEHVHSNVVLVTELSGFRECRMSTLLSLFKRYMPDIVIPVGLADPLHAMALWKLRGGRAKLVVCMHTNADLFHHDVKACSEYIDLAASVSKRGSMLLEEVLPGRVAHIPTGVHAGKMGRIRIRKELNLAYIGRLEHSEKRVLDLIELMTHLKSVNVRLHVVGKGKDEQLLRSALEGDISCGRVLFYGQITNNELYENIYQHMDALIVLSKAEGGPIVAWEAMANGVIPVVSDYIGRREEGVIKDKVNALVFDVGDMRGAAACIASLLDKTHLEYLSSGARALPIDYSVDKFGDNWDAKLKEVIASPIAVGSSLPVRCVSPGRLLRAKVPLEIASLTRRIFRMRYRHKGPDGEWPGMYGVEDGN